MLRVTIFTKPLVFLIFKRKEDTIKDIENNIRALQDDLDKKLSQNNEKRKLYYGYKEEIKHLMHDLDSKKRDLDKLKELYNKLLEEGKNDPMRLRYLNRLEEKTQHERKKADLEKQLDDELNADSEEKVNAMMNQLKVDRDAIKTLQNDVQTGRQKTEALLADIEKMKAQIQSYTGSTAEQYKKLKEQNKQVEDYISKFDSNKQTEVAALAEQQEMVVQMLEHISEAIIEQESIPSSQEQFNEMKDMLEFKAEQKKQSESTLEILKRDLEKLKKEDQKLKDLDKKIAEEHRIHEEKIKIMSDELVVYKDIDSLKLKCEEENTNLRRKKDDLFRMRETMKSQMHMLTRKHDMLKKKLTSDQFYELLVEYEQKIQVYEQNNFTLKECTS